MHILRLIPWAIAGIVILLWQDIRSGKINIPRSRWFATSLGLLGGFATMMGNAAGPVMALYLLSMHLPKNSYIGTAAWFFFIVNLSKVPLHVWSWKTFSLDSLLLDLVIVTILLSALLLF